MARNQDSACTGTAFDGTDPSLFRCLVQALLRSRPPLERGKALSSLENCPLRDQARFNEPPQRHNQLARDRYDRNPAEAALRIRDTLAIPDGKPTFRLMPKPQPS